MDTIISKIITEVRGELSDQQFADALGQFTKGKLHPNFNTINKWRTGQREPTFDTLSIMLRFGIDKLSQDTLIEFLNCLNLSERCKIVK